MNTNFRAVNPMAAWKAACVCLVLCLFPMTGSAQLSTNADKFLGNITTRGQVDYGNEPFWTLWNQITPENESKWESIEGRGRGVFNWGSDNAYNYAKRHNFPFKFHCLIWGAQYPSWLNSLSTEEQYKAIEEWFDAVKAHYPDLPMIDVVNEAVAGHQPAPYKNALGGDGKTGFDWIIKAFEMAHERWPDAILIYNDYNTFQWQRTQFIDLVRTLRDAGAPIDAYGCQSHDLTDMNVNDFKAAMTEIQNALKMPMYSTEYDIGTTNDSQQLQRYKEQIPYMWESDYCAGITLWGYIYGATWTTDGNSGIIRNGQDRPAMTWLREYMASDAAKNAKSPFPGMKKEASVYVKPSSIIVTKGDDVPVTVRARLSTKTIDHVDFYVNNNLVSTMTEAPYTTSFNAPNLGHYNLKAVVVATDGTEYERLSGVTAFNPRQPYKGVTDLPGTLEAEDFDSGAEGITFHDSDNNDEGNTHYRSDNGGVDIVTGNNSHAIGYTSNGEWLEYTVNVQEEGIYSYDAFVSSGVTSSSFSLSLNTDEGLVQLTPTIAVPSAGSNNWSTYFDVYGRLLVPLKAGQQVIRINITGSSCNIDKIVFNHVNIDNDMQVAVSTDPVQGTVKEPVTIKVDASSPTSTIANVKVYVNNMLQKTVTEAPFEATYTPKEKGSYTITVFATDAEGRESALKTYKLTVNNKRIAHKGIVNIPGIFESENFDRGGEGFTFHDSDNNDEGGANYRSDNEGVDIIAANTGYGIGYTSTGEWLEYSVNVTEAGEYTWEAIVSSGLTGSGFSIGLVQNGQVQELAKVSVPQTASNSWGTYKTVKGNISKRLEAGQQIIRLTITGSYCNIDKVELKLKQETGISTVADDGQAQGRIFNLSGQEVNASYKGIVISNGKKMVRK